MIAPAHAHENELTIDPHSQHRDARGGHLMRHVFLRRGRIYWQMSREDLIRQCGRRWRHSGEVMRPRP